MITAAVLTGLVGLAVHHVAVSRLLRTTRATRLLRTRLAAAVTTACAGVLGGLLAWQAGTDAAVAAYCWVAAVAPTLAAIDVLEHRLPDVLTLISYPVLLSLLAIAAIADGNPAALLGAVSGMAAFGGFYGTVAALTGKMGLGDVKLAGALGLILGYRGLSTTLTGMTLGLLAGALVGGALLMTRRGDRHTPVPFGPALLAGTLTALAL